MPSVRDDTPGAIAWASIETFLRQGIQFGSGIVLARLLTPADFGLVAMLGIFIAFATLLVNSGFASALIQQREENIVDSSTVFWFNIASGTVMALALGVCAPLIARFFGHPELVPITWAMALNLWLTSWLTVHTALLTRHLNFRVQAKASGISNLAGAAVAILLALRGAGVWALVAQILATTLLNVMLIWWMHRWRPVASFSGKSFRRMFGFGGFMLAADILNALSTRLYTLLIGRLYSSSDLGLYSRGVTTRDASQTMLGTIFSRVALPVLSRHGKDPDALRKRLKAANQLTMALNLPAMIGLALVANVAVPTLFGHQWAGTVPVLQILCLGGALYPLQLSNLQVLMAQGHTQKLFRLEVLKKTTLVMAVLIASQWGILAIAWSTVFSAAVSFLINAHYSRTLVGYGPFKQLRDLGTYVGLTVAMAVIVVATAQLFSWLTPGKRLAAEVLVGGAFYLSLAFALRLPAIRYALDVFKSLRQTRNSPEDTGGRK